MEPTDETQLDQPCRQRLRHAGSPQSGRPRGFTAERRVLVGVAIISLTALAGWMSGSWRHSSSIHGAEPDNPTVAELRGRAERAEDLTWLSVATGAHPWLRSDDRRSDLIHDKHDRLAHDDAFGAARVGAVLAAEAQLRAARVLDRWMARIDPETGLIPKGVEREDQIWDYADAGADLYPHLVIAAALLAPNDSAQLARVMAAERRIAGRGRLPRNVDLATNLQDERPRDEMYGAVEYAKDGLLPLAERLGPGPWMDRLHELARSMIESSSAQTRFGPIPSDEGEVNGQALQVLARLYWASGDRTYLIAAERIARAYLEVALPSTDWIPTRSWDFARERTTTKVAQLRDHGNEVIAGLVEVHLIETAVGTPAAPLHRTQIRSMLDQLLDRGRTREGLWKSAIDFDTGESIKDTLSDNWGYLYSAYLTQALIEERWPNGDPERVKRYRAASATGLRAAAALDLYPWQGTEQDGYADTIESALYLLNRLSSQEAARWVDRQAGTLFGTQDADGRVEDRYLEGNFVRTGLLYAAWQTQGVRLAPWEPGAMLGASPDGHCVVVVVGSGRDWSGRIIFDAPRHRLNLRLPLDYPRLNEWPEWFAAEPGRRYRLDDAITGQAETYDGAALNAGLETRLAAGDQRNLRICPVLE